MTPPVRESTCTDSFELTSLRILLPDKVDIWEVEADEDWAELQHRFHNVQFDLHDMDSCFLFLRGVIEVRATGQEMKLRDASEQNPKLDGPPSHRLSLFLYILLSNSTG